MLKATTTLLLLLCSSLSAQTAIPEIFQDVDPVEFSELFPSETALMQRNVKVDTSLFGFQGDFLPNQQAEHLQIELFNGETVYAALEDYQAAYDGGYTLRYSIPSHEYGMALFSVYNQSVEATIHLDDELYLLHALDSFVATLEMVDPEIQWHCEVEDSALGMLQSNHAQGGQESVSSNQDYTVDVMPVFTQEALSHYSNRDGMYALINLATFEANTSYSLSGAYQRLRIVHIGELFGAEPSSTSFNTNKEALRDPSDLVWDEVHDWRDTYGADFVIAVVDIGSNTSGTAGSAFVMETMSPSEEADAFSVVKWSAAVGNYSYTHELGHCMGLRHHSGEITSSNSVNGYCAGHEDGTTYRTLMNKTSGRTRVLQLSNPAVDFPNGEVSGVSGVSENAKTLNETVAVTANFRTAPDFGHCLTTTYSGDEVWAGHFFNLKPKEDISITGIKQNLASFSGIDIDLEVYWRLGGYEGAEYDSTLWNLLGADTSTALGQGYGTHFSVGNPDVTFEASQTYGIYLHFPSYAGVMTTPTTSTTFQNDDVQLDSGAGRGLFGWSGTAVPDKAWNGTLYYEAGVGEHYADTSWLSTSNQATGFMVDVLPSSDIRIHTFDLNIDDNGTPGSCTVDLYMKEGSHSGFETDPHAWTFLGTDTLTTVQGKGNPTRVVLGEEWFEAWNNVAGSQGIELEKDKLYSFYFHLSSSVNSTHWFRYYATPSGDTGNSDIEFLDCVGRGKDIPFEGTVFSPRGWSGGVAYTATELGPHIELDDWMVTWFGLNLGTYSISKATPNSAVRVAASATGNGPFSSPYGLVSLTPPFHYLNDIHTDYAGRGSGLVNLPSSAQGRRVWVQGLDVATGQLTNGATIVVR